MNSKSLLSGRMSYLNFWVSGMGAAFHVGKEICDAIS